MSSNDYGWHPIEPHEITLEGFDGAVRIEVESLLAPSSALNLYDALGLTTTVRISRPNSSPTIDVSTNHAFYGSLDSLGQNVRAFTSGQCPEFTMTAVGLRMRMYEHCFGARCGTCVTGDVSDILETENFPWPDDDIGNRMLLESESSFHLRFAFQTSVVDPPFVPRFYEGIHRLMQHIQTIGAA